LGHVGRAYSTRPDPAWSGKRPARPGPARFVYESNRPGPCRGLVPNMLPNPVCTNTRNECGCRIVSLAASHKEHQHIQVLTQDILVYLPHAARINSREVLLSSTPSNLTRMVTVCDAIYAKTLCDGHKKVKY